MISFSFVQSTSATATATAAALSFYLIRIPTNYHSHCHQNHLNSRVIPNAASRASASGPSTRRSHMITRPISSTGFAQSTKLKIAVIGFGNFGQFLAKAFIRQGHTVFAHSRSDYASIAQSIGAAFFFDTHDLCEQHPDVILICTSIISTESVLSGKNGWQNLPFVFDKVRIGNETSRLVRVENFLDIFKKEGCRMVEMTCAEHDKYAAGSQFITHTMGRILEKLQLESTPINTIGYETLLDLVENTSSDSFDLYYGLFMYNKNAMEQIERLDLAFEALKKELFGHLHEVLRKQLFGKSEVGLRRPVLSKLPKNGTPLLPAQSETLGNNNN
ncbi:Arogenate dehydrogenase 2 [Abeliophyllum distichum]|uniref:Arogenate dehydrogenase 2 n=1 Tax=Abeliophyllum distichum TaxID=126358 RepID=A0ABD1QTN9_9LAMI